MLLFTLCAFLFASPAHALTASAHSLRIEDSREGNVILGADQAVIERGELYKTVLLLWGHLEISGEVDEVVVLSGHVVFHDGAKLKKTLVVMGGSFDAEPGAQVAAESVVAQVPGPMWRLLRSAGNLWRENVDWVAKAAAAFVTCFLLWLTGWPLFALFPHLRAVTEGQLTAQWPKNLVLGFFGAVAACVVGVLLVISIIGIVLIPFYLVFLFCAGTISYLAAGLWAGHRLLPPKGNKLNPGGFLLGLLALQFLWIVPVWWASLPVVVLWTLGWGATVRSMQRLWR